jgi:hypothetical protein
VSPAFGHEQAFHDGVSFPTKGNAMAKYLRGLIGTGLIALGGAGSGVIAMNFRVSPFIVRRFQCLGEPRMDQSAEAPNNLSLLEIERFKALEARRIELTKTNVAAEEAAFRALSFLNGGAIVTLLGFAVHGSDGGAPAQ